MIPVQRLNHAVLYVRDARRTADFYQEQFGSEMAAGLPGAVFLRAAGSDNHHDLGLFSVGEQAAGPQPGRVGLYHLAWQVGSIRDLVIARSSLRSVGAYTGESDHGATKSVYGKDPDGNEFEIMWMAPPDTWGEYASSAIVAPLDLDAEIARYS